MARLTPIVEGPVGYEAQGYLGQYLIVIPRDRVVAVRQRRQAANPNGSPPGSKRDFLEFPELVAALVRQQPANP